MQSLLDIILRFRRQGQNEVQAAVTDLKSLDNTAALLSQGLAGLAAGAGIAGIVALGREIDELARRGAVFEQLGSVLENFASAAGTSAQAMVSAAQKAAQGTISQYELILNANRALQFEVAKTPEQFAKLVELSTALGRAQGIADTQALEFITTGLARESKLILDNLGLIIDLDKATATYAATLGKTAGDLSTAERKQALLNEAFKQGETAIKANRDASDSAATNFERMDAAIQNSKDALGALFAPAVAVVAENIANAAQAAANNLSEVGKGMGVDDALGKINALENVLSKLSEGRARLEADKGTPFFDQEKLFGVITQQREAQELLTQAQNEYFAGLRLMYPAQAQSAEAMNRTNIVAEAQANILRQNAAAAFAAGTAFDPLNIATNSLSTEQAVLNAALQGAPGWISAMASEAVAAGGSILLVANDVRILKGEIDQLEGAKSGIRNAVIRAAVGVSNIVGDGRAMTLANQQIGEMNFAIGALEQRLKDGTLSQVEFDYELAKLNDTATSTFDAISEADRAAQQLATHGLADAERAASKAEQAFESLKNKVAGVLSGALDPGVGVNPDDILESLGFRSDSINEDARRLADVAVNGFKSPWYEYFRSDFPALFQEFFAGAADDNGIKAQAAQLLKNFQDGLNPELIDKDTAKERVRRMLIGEQRMEELATEIAGELAAEFGGVGAGRIQDLAMGALGGGASGLLGAPDRQQVAEQYGGVGATAAEAFSSGVRGAVVDGDLGSQVTAALDEQLRAQGNLDRLTEGGRLSGSAWGSGFLSVVGDAVPARLVEVLAQLVTPAVDALLLQRQTLQGAR